MNSRQNWLTCYLLILTVLPAFAGEDDEFQLPVQSDGNLYFFVDVCQFEGSQNTTAVEVYYSIDLNQFVTQPVDTNKTAELNIRLALISPANDTIASFRGNKSISLTNAVSTGYSFVDGHRFGLSLDAITLLLSVKDGVSNRRGSVERFFHVRRFTNQLSISDPILSAQVQKAGGNQTFEKGGLVIVPSVARTFSDRVNEQWMFVYFEINHLSFTEGIESFYRLEYRITNLKGETLIDESRPRLPSSGANSARIETISLKDFKSGIYKLILAVTDLTANTICSTERYFNFDSEKETEKLLLPMTRADEKKYYDQIKYIASEEEKKLFRQLSPRGKQQFLLEFWRSRDPDPETSENEFMLEYFRRFAFCEKEFAGGINSDRGRVYITYGPPLEVVREFSKLEFTKPVEVWTYALNGKVEFVFVDRRRDGRYSLVHSTHRDEFNNPSWQQEAQ
jgi:GWxTD domain-containing protein